MPTSSSSLLPLAPLFLLLVRSAGAAEVPDCSGSFRSSQENFVLDTEDAVKEGAALLATAHVRSAEACERACCEDQRCNLALLGPRAPGAATAENRTCDLINCVHRNRFVCRFVNKDGYRSYIRESLKDYRWTLKSGDNGVKMENTELPDQVRLSNLQPGSYEIQLTVTDSNDQSHAANVHVLVLSPEQSTCDIDGVSLSTVTSVRSVALPSAEECGSPCRPGQLTCGGSCCLDRSLECDGVNQCSNNSDEEHCSQPQCSEPPHTGPCRASHVRWYYDPLDRKCFRFTYGGCDANGNNFNDQKTCSESCDGVTKSDVFFRGIFERFDKLEENDSGNIALAVLLSVAILALLVILTYCFLKARKERSHRPVATGPAHVALSEQDTLVYNSTTKPV
ncbi:Kunitz-type protease inhibitor 1 [Nibea albiflora]|uniref:Kunitz-type protease inhibitor 1 n=1 Tax=Nibea albiflora TaxID=240163 RepID=A0ACB7FC47_NIBAL|nr:Kunitz-type protease inhibitor 1 [Nibea albiflora]